MPPFFPRKRLRSSSPESGASKPAREQGGHISTPPRKPTLFDDLDAGTEQKRTAEHSKTLLDKLSANVDDESSSDSSEDEFEDVPALKRQRVNDASEDDEDIEFEDVQTHSVIGPSAPPTSGDLELTLRTDARVSLTNPLGTKKGPSKIERGIRLATHQIHVQMLMWHNAVRNSWLCDKELQEILLKQLPMGLKTEVERWRQTIDIRSNNDEGSKSEGKGKEKNSKGKKQDVRSKRNWGEPADPKTSRDPIFRLLNILIKYWRQRFRIKAPGLRKLGYMSLERLDAEMKSYNNGDHDPEQYGERIMDITEFRERAKASEGSRDVSAQLFTALLRGIGIEARMVANLQPLGFGWSRYEDALEKNPRKLKEKAELDRDSSSEDEDEDSENDKKPAKAVKGSKIGSGSKSKSRPKMQKKPAKRSSKVSGLNDPINISELEEGILSGSDEDDDEESVIDVTPATQRTQPSKPYDKDLLFPHYWTEVLSPVTSTYIAVDASVLHKVALATDAHILEKFEPRGMKAEKAKQVTSYIIGHSPDGTAKDVTTRYLKRQVWPGRTKGNRIPVEKIPVYDRHGKVKHYEKYEWFKRVMSCYVRGSKNTPRTAIDDYEDLGALKPAKPEKKVVEEGKETLQYYKTSSEFALERHLKREEAIPPTANHVKMFTVKGKGNTSTEEKVYLREDVVNCKTVETWHKEGRVPIEGEKPLKFVPYRAATTNRRRELADAEKASGEKALQGLYSYDQTEWIIPPPIQNGVIPKNSFGNIDLYVDSMLPQGAVHIPRRATAKICRRLKIDYAEAVTGFEFGYRMAVPIINGVVVAEEHFEAVMEEWEKDEAERVRKEDEKKHKAAFGMWRKMLMGLRIVERLREEYGDEAEGEVDALNPWTNKNKDKDSDRSLMEQDEDTAGGFSLETGFLPSGVDASKLDYSCFFPFTHKYDDASDGGLVVEGHDERAITEAKRVTASDEDQDMRDAESEVDHPPTKRRGRPPGSKNKSEKPKTQVSRTKSKTAAPRQKAPMSNDTVRGRREVEDPEGLDNDETSSLSELSSADEYPGSEVEAVSKQPKGSLNKKSTSRTAKTTETQRKTPLRNAARKSVDAVKSHYFAHSEDNDDK